MKDITDIENLLRRYPLASTEAGGIDYANMEKLERHVRENWTIREILGLRGRLRRGVFTSEAGWIDFHEDGYSAATRDEANAIDAVWQRLTETCFILIGEAFVLDFQNPRLFDGLTFADEPDGEPTLGDWTPARLLERIPRELRERDAKATTLEAIRRGQGAIRRGQRETAKQLDETAKQLEGVRRDQGEAARQLEGIQRGQGETAATLGGIQHDQRETARQLGETRQGVAVLVQHLPDAKRPTTITWGEAVSILKAKGGGECDKTLRNWLEEGKAKKTETPISWNDLTSVAAWEAWCDAYVTALKARSSRKKIIGEYAGKVEGAKARRQSPTTA